MRHTCSSIMVVLTLLLGLTATTKARTEREERTFDGIKVIRINTISGDCVIQKGTGNQVKVEVVWSYRPSDSFEPKFTNRGEILKLSEEFYDSNSGQSVWTLTVPDSIEIKFNSASGGIEATGLALDLSGETASGDYRFDNCRGTFNLSSASGNVDMESTTGEFEITTASGNIRMIGCEGEFELSSASGDVESDKTAISAPSSFSAASGDVDVMLSRVIEHDLALSSASGDAELNLGGNPIQGHFEFTSRYREGRIEAPYDFDDEEDFREHGDRYERKWFTKGSDKPEILIQTSSGTAALSER
jgi:DUF4097 and DUF4098 domain-containing protein YvlB